MATLEGYAKLAEHISRIPEHGMVRTFNALHLRSILYQQAELVKLEAELTKITLADSESSDPERQRLGRNWLMLQESLHGGHDEQLKKTLEVRDKLRLYHESLLRQSQLSTLRKPTKYQITFMRGWLAGTQMGNLPITSDDKHSWDQEYEHDLVALDPQSPSDPFSLWTREKLIPHYHWYFGRKLKKSVPWAPDSGVAEYAESGIQLAVNVISTVVSCLFPVLSIVVLYYVKSMNARLGIVAAFTAIFSSSLALLTGAKRVEIFAATSAFAGVQVVFIGTNGNYANSTT